MPQTSAPYPTWRTAIAFPIKKSNAITIIAFLFITSTFSILTNFRLSYCQIYSKGTKNIFSVTFSCCLLTKNITRASSKRDTSDFSYMDSSFIFWRQHIRQYVSFTDFLQSEINKFIDFPKAAFIVAISRVHIN